MFHEDTFIIKMLTDSQNIMVQASSSEWQSNDADLNKLQQINDQLTKAEKMEMH